MMPLYDYVEISTERPRRSSFSHYHRPRHVRPRCPDNCARVSLDEYNSSVENERTLRALNQKLTDENNYLRTGNQELQDKVNHLRVYHSRDEKHRRRIESLRAEVENKERALRSLEREKELADIRVRELSQTVTDQGLEINALEDKLERSKRIHKQDQNELGVRNEELREAWSLVKDLRRQLHRCREPFSSFRSRYDFGGF
ncbi:hypothetical protein GGR51DRAFT_20311 [Nemania sp. FL0031]|nr:hypothetical protein GGR51DRAFT_20311 [Nemania sp. FL0031]